MINFDALCLSPIYEALGTDALIITTSGDERTFRVIDKSAGVEISFGDTSVQTLKPAAVIRMSELSAKLTSLNDIDDGQIVMNGTRWRIKGSMKIGSPEGETKGEAYLLLADEKLDE